MSMFRNEKHIFPNSFDRSTYRERLSGTTADFGTADHQLTAQILKRSLGPDLRVLIASVSMFGHSGDFEEYVHT